MKYNVVQLVSNTVWGGGEQYILDLSRRLEADGHSVAVITRGKAAVDSRFIEAGFTPGHLRLGGILDFISPIYLSRALNRMAAPIIIHAHNFKEAETAVRARALMNEPSKARIVVTLHLVRPAKTGKSYQRLYNQIDRIIFVSQAAADTFFTTLPDIDKSRYSVVYNAVETREDVVPLPKDETEIRIVYIGRIVAEKGLDTLIKAFAKVADIKGLSLKIAGVGNSRDVMPLLQTARQLDIENRIEWLGHVNDIFPLMASADIGVLPSRVPEAFGLVTAEFMTQGVPVIASNCGASPEIISDGKNGLLFPAEDDTKLAEAIRRLATDADLRKQIGTTAKADVSSRFTLDKFYTNTLAAYATDNN